MKEELEKAYEAIKNGGVILYPTDTIWGLGCDPNNELAISKIQQIKNRTNEKSMLLLVNSERLLQRYVKEIPDVCFDLIDYSERPLTIVYPQGQYVSEKILGEDGSLAIRITKNTFAYKLIERLKHGIISTSANVTDTAYASNDLKDIPESIKNSVDYIVNLPLTNKSVQPSQIIKIEADSTVTIIRK